MLSSVLAGVSAPVLAEGKFGFSFRVYTKEKLSTWSNTSPIYHPWTKVGSHYDCGNWSPLPEEVNFGEAYQQTRDCSQNEQRNVDLRQLDSFSNTVKIVRTEQENRVVTEQESQPEVGTYRDWIAHDSTFTEWQDVNAPHSHTAWSPTATAQTTNFVQSRNYLHKQERYEQEREIDTVTGDIRNDGSPILRSQEDPRSENRNVTTNFTDWEDTTQSGHTAWLPVNYNETADFQQTREYGQHQIRDRFYEAEGSEIARFGENRVVSPVYENRTINVESTNWADTTRTAHTTWSPFPTNETANYNQSRSYTQNQERTWTYKHGSDVLSTRVEPQALTNQSESRLVTVTNSNWQNTTTSNFSGWGPVADTQTATFNQSRSYKQHQTRGWIYSADGAQIHARAETQALDKSESRQVVVTNESWQNTSVSNHGAWGPVASTQTANFTQSRSYDQNQQRGWFYTVDGSQIHSRGEVRSLSQSENRQVIVTNTGWTNTSRSNESAWSPAASSQTSNFNQSRTYSQNQTRSWTYTANSTQIHTRSDSQVLNNQSESRTVTVSSTGWTNTGGLYSCSGWSPATNTVASGQSFTQTRSCSQNQSRTHTYRIGGNYTQTRTQSVSDSQQATGTYVKPSYSVNLGGGYMCDECGTSSSANVSIGSGTGYTTITFTPSYNHTYPGDINFSVSGPCGSWGLGRLNTSSTTRTISASCDINGRWYVSMQDELAQDEGSAYMRLTFQ